MSVLMFELLNNVAAHDSVSAGFAPAGPPVDTDGKRLETSQRVAAPMTSGKDVLTF